MKVEFKLKKYGFRFTITRITQSQFDVFLFLQMGYGDLQSYFDSKGIYFYADAFHFGTPAIFYQAHGFEKVLKKGVNDR